MKISVKSGKFNHLRTPLIAIFLFKNTKTVSLAAGLEELDSISGGRLSEALRMGDFKGELNDSLMLYLPDGAGIHRILIVGLGKKQELNTEKIRQAFGTAARTARDKKIKRFHLCLNGIELDIFKPAEIALAASEGAMLALYQFIEFKTVERKKYTSVSEIIFFSVYKKYINEYKTGVASGKLFAEMTSYARDLASYPGNVVTPSYLAAEAENIARQNSLKCTIFDEKKLCKINMNALLGVAKGSNQPPRLIVLEYFCDNPHAKTVTIIGKGMTFDSGGISIKPSNKMEEMKYDMSGAAAVLAVMKMIRTLAPAVNVVGIVAAAENMPGGNAQKPGDIVKTYSGLTVEIINTDAEGRLVLCDALAYAVKTYKPAAVIDLATLTGAVVVALGHFATGMLGNNQALLKKIADASHKAGEMVWELPIYPEFDEYLKSDTADIKNSNGAGGGTIFGAAFLKKFVGKIPWAHLDIAGTAYDVKEKSYLPKGPTGVGVRLLARLLKDWK